MDKPSKILPSLVDFSIFQVQGDSICVFREEFMVQKSSRSISVITNYDVGDKLSQTIYDYKSTVILRHYEPTCHQNLCHQHH